MRTTACCLCSSLQPHPSACLISCIPDLRIHMHKTKNLLDFLSVSIHIYTHLYRPDNIELCGSPCLSISVVTYVEWLFCVSSFCLRNFFLPL